MNVWVHLDGRDVHKGEATSWKSGPLFLLVIKCQAASMSPGYLIYKMMGCRRQGILALAAH